MAVAAAAEGTSRRRILDYLNDGEEFGVAGPSSSAAATPRALAAARSLLPRFRWARLARLGGKGKGRTPKAVVVEEETVAVDEEGELSLRDASGASASSGTSIPAACAAAPGDGGGGDTTRPSGLGVGLSLVFLLAKTSDEFNKMARVRAEMEALIRDFKGQQAMATTTNTAANDDEPRNPESAASSCLTDGNEPQAATARCEDRRHGHHRHQVASSSGAEMEAASRRRMDVLEEEFHAELDRVRAGYGADTPPFSTGEERDEGGAEPSDDDDDDGIAGCRQGFESDLGDDDDDRDNNEDDEEEEEEDDDDADRYHGVSAIELERRLHELLHQRNQERIQELEAALRRAEKRLFDKEMEASLWKDTAKMAFRHDHDDDDSP